MALIRTYTVGRLRVNLYDTYMFENDNYLDGVQFDLFEDDYNSSATWSGTPNLQKQSTQCSFQTSNTRRKGAFLDTTYNGQLAVRYTNGSSLVSEYVNIRYQNRLYGGSWQSAQTTGVDRLNIKQIGGGESVSINIATNIPIFDDATKLLNYLKGNTQGTEALNYKAPETTPDGDMLEITNCWTYGIWLNDTQPQVTEIHYNNFRGKMVSGEFALYPIEQISENKLKMGIVNNAEFYEMQYSTDGVNWTDTDVFPFSYFYRKRINELSPNADTYLAYALTFSNSKIPVFPDETTAQGYINGTVDITEATNWSEISQNYSIINNTGYSDDNTTMGEVYTRAFFSQQYICSESAIQQISNALFDVDSGGATGIWDNIRRGIEMFGSNPIDCVQSCMFFPINLNTVFTNTQSQSYVYFGGYKFDLTAGTTVNKIIYPNGSYDFGSFDLHYSFGNANNQHFRDYAPYCRLYCYLAYIGWVELDTARYIGKTVNVKYYFDTRTGMCMACLFVNTGNGTSCLYDYYQGQCGVSMPITLTDFSAYANAQIQTLLGNANDTKGNMGTVFNAGVGIAEKGMMTAGTGLALGTVGLGAVGIGAVKTTYGLTQNNINNFNKTKGSSSSMLNQYLPQEVMFMFEYQEGEPTPNELSLLGYPSNASGQLQSFSGYLEVDTVKLECPYATDNEKADIIRQLQSGVYI